MTKRALICGVSGQDGALLARFLLARNYEVFGSSRDAQASSFSNLQRLGIKSSVQLLSLAPTDFRSVLQALSWIQPLEIYNLSGQSSVGLSFEQPVETMESISVSTLNFLEAIRFLGGDRRFYSAGSSECFGDTGGHAANENTPFRPRSPYAVAKATAFWQVANYREAYGLYACTGVLFNHESFLRPERFVTQKIVSAACRIALGAQEKLRLGNLSISRDWGWAEEYVDAMWRMLQQGAPEDFVIGTGKTNSLESFVEEAFRAVNLDWREYVEQDASLLRPTDLKLGRCDPSKARELLQWEARFTMRDVIEHMVKAELERLRTS